MDAKVRNAVPEDARRLQEIYSYYVRETAVSFEYDVPSVEEFRSRMENTMKRYPYLVIEKGDVALGYAYAGPFVGREAYSRSCELSIYIDRNARGRGYGRILYETLESGLKSKGILNLYACIASPVKEDEFLTRDSEMFHARLGFRKVGEFHKCGFKFGRWYDMIWMEKIIGEHNTESIPAE